LDAYAKLAKCKVKKTRQYKNYKYKTSIKTMKKYKLIKEYPDSLKKGTIVSKDQLGNYITEKPLFIIESIVVENYPEFWEEVKEEPNYIITAFKSIDSKNSKLINICDDGRYYEIKAKIGVFNLGEMLYGTNSVEDGSFIIHSVKNKNGEEFAIGDIVVFNIEGYRVGEPFSIDNFFINRDGVLLARSSKESTAICEDINTIAKSILNVIKSFNLGEPLFTTVDGLKIYRGQDVTLYIIDGEGYETVDVENFNEEDAKVAERYKCFANKMFLAEQIEQNKIKPILITNDGKRIYEESEKIYAVLAKANWAQQKIAAYNATYRNEDWKYFSTSEARINYIKQNKPTISIADIEKAYTWDKSAPLYIDFINNLKRIVGE